jgi:hypothetical protein
MSDLQGAFDYTKSKPFEYSLETMSFHDWRIDQAHMVGDFLSIGMKTSKCFKDSFVNDRRAIYISIDVLAMTLRIPLDF